MDKKLAIDAGVLTLRFSGDARVREFFDAVADGKSEAFISEINLSEFFYKTCQKLGKQTADTRYYQAIESGLVVVGSEEIGRLAGLEKCRHSSALSLADCFALALAKSEGALLLTTDGALAEVPEVRVRRFPV